MSSFDAWETAFYLVSKILCSFVFISTSEVGFPFSCTHLHTQHFYLRSGKPKSWGSRQRLDVAQFNTWATESAEDASQATRMPGPSNDVLWSLICSWHSGYPTTHWESILWSALWQCKATDHSPWVLPAYKDTEQMRTDQTASQSS